MKRTVFAAAAWIALTGAAFSQAPAAPPPAAPAAPAAEPERGGTLRDVVSRGALNCGVTQGLAGFSAPDDKNQWTGLDVDFCRAIAAAIFNDAAKVKFSPLSAKDRFTALSSGAVDVLSRNTTWTMQRDTKLGFNFTGVMYYDGQGFMVRKSAGVKTAKELDGASICLQTGTTHELNVVDFFRANNMKPKEVLAFGTLDETIKAYESGRCDVFTSDRSQLAAVMLRLTNPKTHEILPDLISKEPLGPLVRQGDEQWFDLVRWTYFALLNAEELGITSKNVGEMVNSTNPEVRRLLGQDGTFGEDIGLTKDWVVRMVKLVGNYGEIYDRNVGPATPLALERGYNNLWTKGGLQYGMPVR